VLWYFTENVKSITNIEIKRSRRDDRDGEPHEIICMMIDGMDEMKLVIPKLINLMKSYSNGS
jgi:hypothetical protein